MCGDLSHCMPFLQYTCRRTWAAYIFIEQAEAKHLLLPNEALIEELIYSWHSLIQCSYAFLYLKKSVMRSCFHGVLPVNLLRTATRSPGTNARQRRMFP